MKYWNYGGKPSILEWKRKKEGQKMTLTKDQLINLTERINERFAEFDNPAGGVGVRIAPGLVRVCHEVIAEWGAEQVLGVVESGPGMPVASKVQND